MFNYSFYNCHLQDIFAGGTETKGGVLAWAMSELVHAPESMIKAQQEVRDVLGEDRAVITNSDFAELHYMRMVIRKPSGCTPLVL